MPKKPELSPIKQGAAKPAKRTPISARPKDDPESDPPRIKKIKKISHPISKIKVRENFDSFYSGGEIQFVGTDGRFFSIFDDKIRVYCVNSCKLLFEIEHKNEEIHNFVTFERNNSRFVITFTKNGMIRLLRLLDDVESQQRFEIIEKKKVLRFLAVEMRIDNSGKYVIMADPKGDFKILNAQTLRVVREFNLGSGYVKMRIVGQYIIFVSRERAIVLYNILTNKKVRHATSESMTTFADFAVLSVQNKQILLSGFDHKIYYFDSKAEQVVPIVQLGGFANIMETINIGDKKGRVLCILGFEDGKIGFFWFDTANGQMTPVPSDFNFKNRHQYQRILFDFTNSVIYFVTDEGEIYKTRLTVTGDDVQLELLEEFVGLNDQIMDLKFISGKYGVVCTNSETIRVVDLENRNSKLLSSHEDIVTCVDIYKEKYMLTGSKDGRIHLWKIVKPEDEAQASEKGPLEFNQATDCQFGINFRLVKKYKAHTHSVTTVRFSPKTGTKFVSAGAEGLMKLWDLKNKTCKSVKPHAKELNFVRISDNEKLIVTGSHDRHINFYDAKDLSLVAQVPAHKRGVWDADFAPVEKLVASASSDLTIKLWSYEDLSRIEQVGVLEGSTGPVLKIKWIVNGLQLISASADGIIKIWNTKKKICVSSFDMHEGRIWSMDVYETGEDKLMLLSGDNNNRLLLWEDITLETTNEALLADQENKTAVDHLNILIRQKEFKKAAKFAFERSMPATFFDTIAKWRSEHFHRTEKVYEIEDEISTEDDSKRQEFEEALSEFVNEIFISNKKKLMILLKNFVTHSKYSVVVQCILKGLLAKMKLAEMTDLSDDLRNQSLDLQQLLEVYKVFTERHYSALRRNLRLAHSFNLFVEKHREVIN